MPHRRGARRNLKYVATRRATTSPARISIHKGNKPFQHQVVIPCCHYMPKLRATKKTIFSSSPSQATIRRRPLEVISWQQNIAMMMNQSVVRFQKQNKNKGEDNNSDPENYQQDNHPLPGAINLLPPHPEKSRSSGQNKNNVSQAPAEEHQQQLGGHTTSLSPCCKIMKAQARHSTDIAQAGCTVPCLFFFFFHPIYYLHPSYIMNIEVKYNLMCRWQYTAIS